MTDTDALMLFTRDLRTVDNTVLNELLRSHRYIYPLFVFNPQQVSGKRNAYKSNRAVRFMVSALQKLNARGGGLNGALRVAEGDPATVVESILVAYPNIATVGITRDYTPFANKRSADIHGVCNRRNVSVLELDDTLLYPLGTVRTVSGGVYKKYTPFKRKAEKTNRRTADLTMPSPRRFRTLAVPTVFILTEEVATRYTEEAEDVLVAGRSAGLKILAEVRSGTFSDYGERRDELTYETTWLSAYLKFGCVSVREAADAAEGTGGLWAQLVWRDFFYNLAAEHPEIFNKRRNGLTDRPVEWRTSTADYTAWTAGVTGFPIVDACMRQLNETGYMHNRGRLIVSNFFTRVLRLDWHLGERYFAQQLVDYDPVQNSFGWQLSAALSGTESRPYPQTMMNPWLQSKKFDADAVYIKRWCPEYSDIPAKQLHAWNVYSINYPWLRAPIADYGKARAKEFTRLKRF